LLSVWTTGSSAWSLMLSWFLFCLGGSCRLSTCIDSRVGCEAGDSELHVRKRRGKKSKPERLQHSKEKNPEPRAIMFVVLTLLLTYNLLLRTTGDIVPRAFFASATADCFISSCNLRPAWTQLEVDEFLWRAASGLCSSISRRSCDRLGGGV
jgi:hypothetical protein